jgi:hypothetical protein
VDLIRFGIVGGGWRARSYLRIAQELPDRFHVCGVVVRDEAKGQALERAWRVSTHTTLDALLSKSKPHFVVVSVPWSTTPVFIRELANRELPVLAETPPAPDLEGLIALHRLAQHGAKIQVAEQYPYQPLNAALLAIARSGVLGTVAETQVSVAHTYHGMSVMRKLLGIRFQNPAITARAFVSPIVAGPNRHGDPTEERIVPSKQIIAHLDFGDKFGVYDFAGDQYFSLIRSKRLVVWGDRGEIVNTHVKYLKDFRTLVSYALARQDEGAEGGLLGYYHRGILGGGEWIFRNPFAPGRLTDDEIAIATCLDKMAEYVRGGPGFYGLAEASQDHYLGLMIEQAVESKGTVKTMTQPWAEG